MRCILQTCCGEGYKSYLDGSGNLVSDWSENIRINTDLLNEPGLNSEQLLEVLKVKLQSFQSSDAPSTLPSGNPEGVSDTNVPTD